MSTPARAHTKNRYSPALYDAWRALVAAHDGGEYPYPGKAAAAALFAEHAVPVGERDRLYMTLCHPRWLPSAGGAAAVPPTSSAAAAAAAVAASALSATMCATESSSSSSSSSSSASAASPGAAGGADAGGPPPLEAATRGTKRRAESPAEPATLVTARVREAAAYRVYTSRFEAMNQLDAQIRELRGRLMGLEADADEAREEFEQASRRLAARRSEVNELLHKKGGEETEEELKERARRDEARALVEEPPRPRSPTPPPFRRRATEAEFAAATTKARERAGGAELQDEHYRPPESAIPQFPRGTVGLIRVKFVQKDGFWRVETRQRYGGGTLVFDDGEDSSDDEGHAARVRHRNNGIPPPTTNEEIYGTDAESLFMIVYYTPRDVEIRNAAAAAAAGSSVGSV
jgi:hypothetical protein